MIKDVYPYNDVIPNENVINVTPKYLFRLHDWFSYFSIERVCMVF